jgi:hypothetical protein
VILIIPTGSSKLYDTDFATAHIDIFAAKYEGLRNPVVIRAAED